jgi:hypothetical protein
MMVNVLRATHLKCLQSITAAGLHDSTTCVSHHIVHDVCQTHPLLIADG